MNSILKTTAAVLLAAVMLPAQATIRVLATTPEDAPPAVGGSQ